MREESSFSRRPTVVSCTSPFAKLAPPKEQVQTGTKGEEAGNKQVDQVQGCVVFLQPGTTNSPGTARAPGTVQAPLCCKVVVMLLEKGLSEDVYSPTQTLDLCHCVVGKTTSDCLMAKVFGCLLSCE